MNNLVARAMNSIAAKIIFSMLLVAFATIGIPAVITLFSAEQQFRQPDKRRSEVGEVWKSVEALCETTPPKGLVCPSKSDAPRQNRREQPRNAILPFLDPRPWVLQAVVSGVGISLVLALGLALLLSRRIGQPLRNVASAAAQVAQGDFSARAKVVGQDELGRLAQNFNQMAQALEAQEQQRRNLFADIAHELRTPLTAIKARLEALEDGVMPLDIEAVQRLTGQTKLLERLVEDLRTLSLADAGALKLEMHPTDVQKLCKDTLETFHAKAEQKGIALELLGSENATLQLDAARMQQAIGNLLENALAHTPSGGTVRLELEKHLIHLELRVSDTGSGIPPEALERIFERLYRLESSRNRATGGSGLGLAIVKTIVGLHGGTIRATNRSEGGAVLTIRLPLEPT
jgi:two-component system, OmpR family, sensor histidine kinase BaeS